MHDERPTTARIDLDAAAENLREAAARADGRALIAVVKADAYGHGAVPLARSFLAAGCRRLAVVTVAEAVALREAGVGAPILLLGGLHGPEEARAAWQHGLVPVLHDRGQIELAVGAAPAATDARALPVQVEVDSGMTRMGVDAGDAAGFLAALTSQPTLRLQGLFTHLARADEPDLTPTRAQLARFGALLEELAARGIAPPELHVANSAGLLAGGALADAMPAAIGAARPGLMLYGVSPASHFSTSLRPVMALGTAVVALREVSAGTPVGYGGDWRAPAAGIVATLPVGYADGLPWSLARCGEVVHRGRRLPLAGRVSMDYATVFCRDRQIALGDAVELFGGGGQGVEELAAAAGTIPYELLTRVGARVRRIYHGGD